MTHRIAVSFAALCMVCMVAGCANNQVTQSGQLKNYARLTPTDHASTQVFRANAFHAVAYQKIEIAAPVLIGKSERIQSLDQAARDELLSHVRTKLEAVVKTVEPKSAGGGTLIVRAALTDFDAPNRWVNVIATAAIGPVTTGGATLEISVVDSAIDQEVLAMVCAEKANVLTFSGFTGAYSKFAHAKAAISECVARFSESFAPNAPAAKLP